MLPGTSFIIFIGLFCALEGLPAGLLYQRMFKYGRHGKEVVEIFYNGIEPPKCNKAVCNPMDDSELTEYLRKSLMSMRGPSRVPIVNTYPYPEEGRTEEQEDPEDPTTTENLFISQEEGEEEEWKEDDNSY
ncbi:hypothetical protein ACFFRR_001867 [Megaselia abdita]